MRNDYLESALEKYMQYVKSHIAYGIMERQQIARTNISLIDLSEASVSNKILLKHLTYDDIYNKAYVKIPAKYLVPGERLYQKDIRNIRYKLFTVHEMTKMFGSSVDIFYNGYKIPYDEIRIAIFDFYFIVELPIKYRNPASLLALLRPYVFDEIYTTSTIRIKKSDINKIDDNNDFFLYVDGRQSVNYTIVEDSNYYNIRCSDVGIKYEITYIRHLNYYGKKSIVNSHLNILDLKRKFPIPGHNIITFNRGLLINLELETKTDGIYRCSNNINDQLDLYYVYTDYEFESADYNDSYRWLAQYRDDFMDIINNPNKLPDFANVFQLFKKDISLQDYLEFNYKNINDYHFDRSIDTINWCEECFLDIIKFIYEEYSNDNQFTIESQYMNVADTGKNNLIRENNYSEIIDPQYRSIFGTPMFLIKLPNLEEFPFAIYIDGIRYSENMLKYRELGIDYIYINPKNVLNNSYIEIEKFKTKSDGVTSMVYVSKGNNIIQIKDVKKNGFIKYDADFRHISLSKQVSNVFTNIDNIVNNISYEDTTDTMSISLKENITVNTVLKIYNMNFHKIAEKTTRTSGDGMNFTLDWLDANICNKENIRVFKNGHELPRSFYDITLPNSTNGLNSPSLNINIRYGIYELITVEYSSTKFKQYFYKDLLLQDGIVDLYNTIGLKELYISKVSQYFTLNGIRLTPAHYKFWCSKGITIFDHNSVHYFSIMLKTDDYLQKIIDKFIETYKNHSKLLDKYIMELMIGSLYDDNDVPKYDPINPPLKPGDDELCTEPDPVRRGKVYYDIYNEFLKLNIINSEARLPDYILIKYGELVDSATDVLKVDASQKMLKWMPLDGNSLNANDESIRRIMDLYYKLLDDIEGTYIIDADSIPDEIYNKYKDLFDNGVLVLQVPDISQL